MKFFFFILLYLSVIICQNGKLIIGIRPFYPLSNCTPFDKIPLEDINFNDISSDSRIFGYEVELILYFFYYYHFYEFFLKYSAIIQNNNWNITQFELHCLEINDILSGLLTNEILFSFGGKANFFF